MKYLFYIAVFITGHLSAQITFQKTYGSVHSEQANAVIQAYDSSYVVVGSSSLTGYSSDVYILKVDSLGNYLWSKYYGGSNVDVGTNIIETPDSGFAISGYTNSYGAGGYDMYLLKLDKDGNFEWDATFGGSDWDMGHSLNIMSDSGFVLVGQTYSYGAGNSDGYIVRTDKFGNLLWENTSGTSGEDIFYDLYTTAFANYMIVGSTDGMGAGGKDIYLARYGQLGDELWTTTQGGPGDDEGRKINPIFSHYNIVGSTDSYGLGGSDIYLCGIDGNGILLYDDTKGSPEDEFGYDLAVRNPNWVFMVGDIYVPNETSNNYVGYYANSVGGYINSFSDGGDKEEHCSGVAYTYDDSFILCGNTESYSYGGSDIYLIKLGEEPYTNNSYDIDDQYVDFTDVDDKEFSAGVKMYPNPANYVLLFDGVPNNTKITMFNALGKKVLSTYNESNSINCENLSDGVYHVRFTTSDNRVCTKSVVVKH